MDNQNQVNIPPFQPQTQTPTLPSTNWGKTLFVIIFGLIIVVGSIFAGIQIGKKQIPNQQTAIIIPTEIPIEKPAPTSFIQPTQTIIVNDETAGWKIYSNSDFTFKQPNLDSQCCGVAGPLDIQTPIVVFADINSVIPNSDAPFDGFAIYINENSTNQAFNEYVEGRKQALIDNYKMMTDKNIAGQTEEKITIDGQTGVELKKYTWWGANLIFIPYPKSSKILIISQNNKNDSSFDKVFNQILSTFKFTK